MQDFLSIYGKRAYKSMRTVLKIEMLRLKFHNKIVNYLNEYNLTFNQFKVLEILYNRGDFSIGEITKLTISTPGNITVVIRNLKRDGWIETIKNPNDNRASILTLTDKSRDIIKEVFPIHAKELTDCLSTLKEEEIDTLYELLSKLYEDN